MTTETHTTPENAIQRQLSLPPALLEEIGESPDSLARLSRVQLAVVHDRLVKKLLTSPDATVSHYTAVSEQLRKTAGIAGPTQSGGGSGFTVNIVVNGAPAAASQGRVIDHGG